MAHSLHAYCSACGQYIPPKQVLGIKLSANQQFIFDAVAKAGTAGIRSDVLFERLYRGVENGGPLTGRKCMHVQISYLNRKLKKVGKRVRGTFAGNHSPGNYYLVDI